MPELAEDRELITGDSSLMNPLQSIMGALQDETFLADILGDPEQLQKQDFVPVLSTVREATLAANRFKEAKEAPNLISSILRNAEGLGHSGIVGLDILTPLIPMAGILKTIHRGFEAGTLHKAFNSPLEMGGHFAVDKSIAERFQLRYGENGNLLSITKDLKPLKVTDTGGEWTPLATALSIEKADDISDTAKKEILDIGLSYHTNKLKASTVPDLEKLQIEGNKKIQRVLEREGYDSLSYQNSVVGEYGDAVNRENIILFKNPLDDITNKAFENEYDRSTRLLKELHAEKLKWQELEKKVVGDK